MIQWWHVQAVSHMCDTHMEEVNYECDDDM